MKRVSRTAPTGPASEAGTVLLGGDLPINRMGFGSMRLTGPGQWGPPADRAEAIRVLQRAVTLGVNFIDTANSYGPHVAEQLIADALYPYQEDLVIATKGGFDRTGPGQWTINCDPVHLRKELEGSLKRLRLDCLDLYQLHRIDSKIPADDQFGMLADFQREGKVRHVGLSEVSVADIERARTAVPIVSVQNRYNVYDRKWEDVVRYCERETLIFLPWAPLDSGRMAQSGGVLAEVAERRDTTPMSVAIAWLLTRAAEVVVIPGTSSLHHLEENVAAAGIGLSEDDIRLLNEAQKPAPPA